MSLVALAVATALLSLERAAYIVIARAPDEFRALCGRPALARHGEPIAILEKPFYAFKGLQLAVFDAYAMFTAAASGSPRTGIRSSSGSPPGSSYLVNNYGLGFAADGTLKPLGPTHFTLPPQNFPTIADALSAARRVLEVLLGRPLERPRGHAERGILRDLRSAHRLHLDHDHGPQAQPPRRDAVLPGRPGRGDPAGGLVHPALREPGGHPADSTPPAYEGFVSDIIARIQSNPAVWAKAVILITTDEGGGYYDSGYIQTIDFFGDGTRIPLIAVSPWAKRGYVDHTYTDHVSILKFIEKNWGLRPLSDRSRDNLPNPAVRPHDPYLPANPPAIGDLLSLFDFGPGENEDGR